MKFNGARGIVYDLDGTIIDTEKFHEDSWLYAANQLGVTLSRQMLIDQKGIPGKDAARMMLGDRFLEIGEKFMRIRKQYVIDNLRDIDVFDGFTETTIALQKRNLSIGICTSAGPDFYARILNAAPELRPFSSNVVMKGDYQRGKPNAEPLLRAAGKLGISSLQSVYVGDAHADWQTAENAKSGFIYFCNGTRDPRIPRDIPAIRQHRQLLDYF